MSKHFLCNFSSTLAAILVAVGLLSTTVAYAAETPAKNNPPPKAVDEAKRATARPSVEPAAHPAVAPAKEPAADSSPPKPQKLRFQFRFQPWKDVLDWFAKQADLSLVMDAPPPGTFNYTDTHEYTPAEAIDLLNSVLLTKGYTLIRRNRMLMLVNLEDGIPRQSGLDRPGEFARQAGANSRWSASFSTWRSSSRKRSHRRSRSSSVPKARSSRWADRGRSP